MKMKQNKSNSQIFKLGLVLMCIGVLAGCGFFGESEYERKQREQYLKKEQNTVRKKAQLQVLQNKYNATLFPPNNISYGDFTYKFQQYFMSNEDKNIIFKGDVDDIWSDNGDIFIEFVCSLADSFSIGDIILSDYRDGIVFRLKVGDIDVHNIRKKPDDYEYDYDIIRDFFDQFIREKHLIVAQISKVMKGRIFEHSASGYGADTEIEMDKATKVIAYGKLIAYEKYGMELAP